MVVPASAGILSGVYFHPLDSDSWYYFVNTRSDTIEVYSTFIIVKNTTVQFNASDDMTFVFYDFQPDHLANAGDLIFNYTIYSNDNTSYVEYKFGNLSFERPMIVYKDGNLFYVQTEPIPLKFVAENKTVNTVGLRFYDGLYYVNEILSDESLVSGVVSNVMFSDDETSFDLNNNRYSVKGYIPLSDGDVVTAKVSDGKIEWMYVNLEHTPMIGSRYEIYVASAQAVGIAPPAPALPAVPSLEVISSNVGYAIAVALIFLVIMYIAKRRWGG